MSERLVAAGPRPWHRAVAGGIVAIAVALAVWVVLAAGPSRVSYCRHVLGASALLYVFGGTAGPVVAPRVVPRLFAVFGWLLPATVLWYATETWLDWKPFYDANLSATTQSAVRVVGTVIGVLGVAATALYVALVVYAIRRHRDPSLPTLAQRLRRRREAGPTAT